MRGSRPLRDLERAALRSGALAAGEHVVVACSGGADSVGLAAVLRAIARPLNLHLTLAHVNHGVRASAWQDEAVALRVAADLSLTVRVAALDGTERSEQALRRERYAALERIAVDVGAVAVAVGHHAHDQTETLLLALFRGTGIRGLAGMPARRALGCGVSLVRPLLRVDPALIRAYVQHLALPYAVDPTNDDCALRRNAVRSALTTLRPPFPNLDLAAARAAEVLQGELTGTERALLRRRLRRTLNEEDLLESVDFEHVDLAAQALERGRSGRFAMGGGVEMTIENGRVTVHRTKR